MLWYYYQQAQPNSQFTADIVHLLDNHGHTHEATNNSYVLHSNQHPFIWHRIKCKQKLHHKTHTNTHTQRCMNSLIPCYTPLFSTPASDRNECRTDVDAVCKGSDYSMSHQHHCVFTSNFINNSMLWSRTYIHLWVMGHIQRLTETHGQSQGKLQTLCYGNV